jgi:uncharacterized protein
MKTVLLILIRIYQRYISPHKGFCCAYHTHTDRRSCSNLGFRAIRRFGAIAGLCILRRRLYLCGVAFRRYAVIAAPIGRTMGLQRGFCDVGGCDAPCDLNFDIFHGKSCAISDFVSCCDVGSCDWQRKKKCDDEKYIYIPPQK